MRDSSQLVAITGFMHILMHIVCIILTYRALQALRIEQLFKKGHIQQIQLLLLFISIVIGSLVSNAFYQIYEWSTWLQYLI